MPAGSSMSSSYFITDLYGCGLIPGGVAVSDVHKKLKVHNLKSEKVDFLDEKI